MPVEVAVSDRIPPHDLDAERAVIGGLLIDPFVVPDVEAILAAADFYHPSHALIFEAECAVVNRGEPLDVVTLASELRARERLNTIGGAQYLGEITDTIATTAHIEQHARIVRDLKRAREMIFAAQDVTARGYLDLGRVDDFIDAAVAKVMACAQERGGSEVVGLDQVLQESFERIEQTMTRGARISGIETGFRDLDNLTAGLHGGELVILAARPAMGKTSLALNMTTHIASQTDKRVLVFSLEMPRIELGNRMMCAEARVDQSRVRSGLLTQDDMTALTNATSKIFNLPISIDDGASVSFMQLRAKAKRMKQSKGLACIVIDYLQLMRLSNERMDSREREIAEISRGLKGLAKDLDVPVIALSQLNRAPETRPGKDRRPQLADLRESGAIEQDADVVMFIYRDEVYNRATEDRGVAEIIVAKQRNGPTDTVRLRFIRELTKFENFAEDEGHYADANAPDVPETSYAGRPRPGEQQPMFGERSDP